MNIIPRDDALLLFHKWKSEQTSLVFCSANPLFLSGSPQHTPAERDGVIMQREEFLKQLTPRPSGVSGSIVISSYSVMMHGDVATVIHIDDEKENYHGERLTARYLTTETFQKTIDGWLLLQVHTCAVLRDPPSRKLGSKELDAYVGKYVAGVLTQTVRRDGDHLVGVRESRPDTNWQAELHDVFFIPGQPRTRKIFSRNSRGKITGFADRREGTDLVWKRVR